MAQSKRECCDFTRKFLIIGSGERTDDTERFPHKPRLFLHLKYGFCRKSPRKNETLTSWTLLAHFYSGSAQIQWAKSVQLVRVTFFLSYFLQNPYFRGCPIIIWTGVNIKIDIVQKAYEWWNCPFAKMIPRLEKHFGKLPAWSLIYFLNYA